MDNFNQAKSEAKDKVNNVYQEGKQKASEAYSTAKNRTESMANNVKDTTQDLFEESLTKVNEIVGSYSGELAQHVKSKPLSSLLIAAGVGYILSSLSKKHSD